MSGNSFPTHVQTASTTPLWPWPTPLLSLKPETLRSSAWAAVSGGRPRRRLAQQQRSAMGEGGVSQPRALPASPTTGGLAAITTTRVPLLSQVWPSGLTHRTQSLVLGSNFNPEFPEKKNQNVLPLLQFEWGHAYGSLQRSSVSSTWMKARPAGWLGGPAGGVRTTHESCDG